jgi:hypothetical protein
VPEERQEKSFCYEVRVEGHLDDLWLDWFEGLSLRHDEDGSSTLVGSLADQAALYGLLERVRDLGVPLLSVHRIESEGGGYL